LYWKNYPNTIWQALRGASMWRFLGLKNKLDPMWQLCAFLIYLQEELVFNSKERVLDFFIKKSTFVWFKSRFRTYGWALRFEHFCNFMEYFLCFKWLLYKHFGQLLKNYLDIFDNSIVWLHLWHEEILNNHVVLSYF
jgi:hypothetical protein